MSTRERGRLVAVEGVDGCGKTTQVRLLAEGLQAQGIGAKAISFPRYEDSVFGDLIRRFLAGELGPADDVHPRLVALLFAGDRGAAAPALREELASGTFLVCDRYFYSNLAYQGAKLAGEELESFERWLRELEFGHHAIPAPDVSLYLDVPRARREERLAARAGSGRAGSPGAVPNDIYERDHAFQSRVEAIFRQVAETSGDLVRIDCAEAEVALSPEEVHERIVEALEARNVPITPL